LDQLELIGANHAFRDMLSGPDFLLTGAADAVEEDVTGCAGFLGLTKAELCFSGV
jgi:hypothetical protein